MKTEKHFRNVSIMLMGCTLIALLSLVLTAHGQEPGASLLAPGAKVKKLAGDFSFTEGPADDGKGNIYFTDIPNNRIHKWSRDGKLSTFLEGSEAANGLIFDENGKLLACRHGSRSVVSIDMNRTITTLADEYRGKKLNSPNDLWIDPSGGIYFTDPRYGNRDNLEQDGEHVYYLSPDQASLSRVIDDFVRPNGIIGTPDGKTIYVADNGANMTYSYRIGAGGSLSGKREFAPVGSDGVALDEKGNLYLTGDAVVIYSPRGRLLEKIEVPERPSNVCFGGKDGKTLFITARTSLYSVRMTVGAAKR